MLSSRTITQNVLAVARHHVVILSTVVRFLHSFLQLDPSDFQESDLNDKMKSGYSVLAPI